MELLEAWACPLGPSAGQGHQPQSSVLSTDQPDLLCGVAVATVIVAA